MSPSFEGHNSGWLTDAACFWQIGSVAFTRNLCEAFPSVNFSSSQVADGKILRITAKNLILTLRTEVFDSTKSMERIGLPRRPRSAWCRRVNRAGLALLGRPRQTCAEGNATMVAAEKSEQRGLRLRERLPEGFLAKLVWKSVQEDSCGGALSAGPHSTPPGARRLPPSILDIAKRLKRVKPADLVLGSKRKYHSVEIGGKHLHPIGRGRGSISIVRRGKAFAGRFRYRGQQHTVTLGDDEKAASGCLQDLLTDLRRDQYVPSKERRRALVAPHRVGDITVRQLLHDYLAEVSQKRGKDTARDYRSRLRFLLRFIEERSAKRSTILARSVDRRFALDFKAWLHHMPTTRNGKPGGIPRPLSPKSIHSVWEQTHRLFAWGSSVDVASLPREFINPFSKDLVGPAPRKDPLRDVPLSMAQMISLVGVMDEWELLALAWLLVMPLRNGELVGILCREVDTVQCAIAIGTRMDGGDFTKGRTSFKVYYPDALNPIMQAAIHSRIDEPLILTRRRRRSRPRWIRQSGESIGDLFQRAVAEDGSTQALADRKALFRQVLRDLGGSDEDEVYRAFKNCCTKAGLGSGIRVHDTRHAVTQLLYASGVDDRTIRYVTGHTTKDILNEYIALEPRRTLEPFWERIEPLTQAIAERWRELGTT